jgi:hypothetical protein
MFFFNWIEGFNLKNILMVLISTVVVVSTVGWALRYDYRNTEHSLVRVNRWTGETCTLGLVDNPHYVPPPDNPIDKLITKPPTPPPDPNLPAFDWNKLTPADTLPTAKLLESQTTLGWKGCNK